MARQNADVIFIGIRGTVLALSRSTGVELWRVSLKGSDFVNLVLDGENLYATTKGEIFCLHPESGKLRWQNKLPGMGFGLVTIATTAGNQTSIAEQKRREEEAAAASSTAAVG